MSEKTSVEVEKNVVRMYKDGKSQKEILNTNGISCGTLYRILEEYGINHGNKKVSRENVIKGYRSGMEVAEVAAENDTSVSTVYQILREAKVPLRLKKRSDCTRVYARDFKASVDHKIKTENTECEPVKCTRSSKYFRTCYYACGNGANRTCDYIGIEGHMRGCPLAACTKYKTTAQVRDERRKFNGDNH